MSEKKFLAKLEFEDALPGSEPMWFDDEEELSAMEGLVRGCPIDGNPPGTGNRARIKITEYELKPKRVRRNFKP